MKAMILAAGLGTRMEELTRDTPKPMLPVLGVPLIAHTLYLLYQQGFSFAAINLHYLGEQIRSYLVDFPYFELQFSYEEEILGTGGGISTALHCTALEGHFWVLNPDSLYLPDFSLSDLQHYFTGSSGHGNRRDSSPLLMLQPRPEGSTENGFVDTNNSALGVRGPDGEGASSNSGDSGDSGHANGPLHPLNQNEATAQQPGSEIPHSVLPLNFSSSGPYMYTGMALLHESQFANLAPNEPFHIVDDWRLRAGESPSELLGYLYSGRILDAGRKSEYLAIQDNGRLFPLTYRRGLSEFMQKWKGSN